MKDFIFVYPDFSEGVFRGCKHYMGTGYIRAFGDYPSSSIDTYISSNTMTWDETAGEICNLARVGAGFTVYNTNYPFIKILADKIKEKRPEFIIICGGPSATVAPEKIMDDCKAIDLCVTGEGEETFREIYLSGFDRLEHIPGLVIRNKTGYHRTGIRKLYKKSRHRELEGIPSPYLKGIIPLSESGNIGIFTTRGCNHLCTYCQFTALGHYTVRCFPEEQVIEELRAICNCWRKKDKNIFISILDDNFTWDIKRCIRILKEVVSFRPANIKFWIDARADNIRDDEFYEVAYNGGVESINFGLESASPEVLNTVKKTGKGENYVNKVREAVFKATEKGIKTTVSTIFGLPEDNPERARQTLDFVKNLPVSQYYHNHLRVYDGTELYHTHKTFGIELEKKPFSPFYFTRHNYDLKDIQVLPNAKQINDYDKGPLLHTILSLTGMINRYINLHIPSSGISKSGEINLTKEKGRLKSGSVIFAMNYNGTMPDNFIIPEGYICNVLTPSGDYYNIDGSYYRYLTPPLIKIPDGKPFNPKPERRCIEFVDPSFLLDSLIESKERLWRLPYSACSLMPCSCPAREKTVLNLDNPSLCPFYSIELNIYDGCSSCEVNDSCPQCPYMLRYFKDKYCSFHRSGRSCDVFIYVLAHFYYLVMQKVDLRLPEIFIEKRDGLYLVIIDKNIFTVKRDISETSYLTWKFLNKKFPEFDFL